MTHPLLCLLIYFLSQCTVYGFMRLSLLFQSLNHHTWFSMFYIFHVFEAQLWSHINLVDNIFSTEVGNMFFLVQNHIHKWKNHPRFGSYAKLDSRCILEHIRSRRRYSSNTYGASISCSTGAAKDFYLPSDTQLADAKVIYSVAPAMGHNQVY